MEQHDVIVVGGGPAGSSCAWRLVRHGVDVLVLDKEAFPRTKLCAGWITPDVVRDLELDPATYPHRFLTFGALRFHVGRFGFSLPSPQHSIRRFEFDAWLLKRSGAPVERHRVRDIRRDGDGFVIDERYRCRRLVGAGGTGCPVYRSLFRDGDGRAAELQVATLEQEFRFDYEEQACHLWFFSRGLPGYSWYVPKADGYLNVGIGATSAGLSERGKSIQDFWREFIGTLDARGYVRNHDFKAKGHSYFLRRVPRQAQRVQLDNAFIIGDSAGLASRDMGEGIGPAVTSGLRVADAIARSKPYEIRSIPRYSLPGMFRGVRLPRSAPARSKPAL
ncbi:MAG: NAD(P)/FAD-dependent oxidoreductase [Gammaproteobacteria bacterium]